MKNWLLEQFNTEDLEMAVSALSFKTVLIATVTLTVLVLVAVYVRERLPHLKAWLFWSIAAVTLATTFILIGATVYLNAVSSSGGPVHWHADFEFWACGEELELKDPEGWLSNKIGTATLHEHNDKRIHLEGVVVEPRDASLGKFMRVVGGSITDGFLVLPTNDGDRTFISGQNCGQERAELQVFVYQTTPDNYYTVQRISNPADYVITDESVVPPGDCIIIEFDTPKEETEHMCLQYKVALDTGKLKGRAQ